MIQNSFTLKPILVHGIDDIMFNFGNYWFENFHSD